MPAPGQITLKGDQDVARALRAVGEEIRERAIPQALRAGGRAIVSQARALAPTETGTLKKSLGLVLRGRRGQQKYVVLGARRGSEFTGVGPDGKKRVPANYAHLVELGHFKVAAVKGTSRRKGTATTIGFVPGQPFLGPALEGSKAEVKAKFIETLGQAQARAAARARRS